MKKILVSMVILIAFSGQLFHLHASNEFALLGAIGGSIVGFTVLPDELISDDEWNESVEGNSDPMASKLIVYTFVVAAFGVAGGFLGSLVDNSLGNSTLTYFSSKTETNEFIEQQKQYANEKWANEKQEGDTISTLPIETVEYVDVPRSSDFYIANISENGALSQQIVYDYNQVHSSFFKDKRLELAFNCSSSIN